MVERYFDLKAMAKLGHRYDNLDAFEAGCFEIIEDEINVQKKIAMKQAGKGGGGG
jgi:hypothetical protein